jgi:hypothetical protein
VDRVTAAALSPEKRLGPGGRLALACEILGTYAQVRWSLRQHGLREALHALRSPARSVQTDHPVATGRRLGRAVARTLALLPTDSRCLMQSLVLTRVLARRGIDTRLVIAVRPGERLAAHAWVEHGEEPLLPSGAPAFEQLVTL